MLSPEIYPYCVEGRFAWITKSSQQGRSRPLPIPGCVVVCTSHLLPTSLLYQSMYICIIAVNTMVFTSYIHVVIAVWISSLMLIHEVPSTSKDSKMLIIMVINSKKHTRLASAITKTQTIKQLWNGV